MKKLLPIIIVLIVVAGGSFYGGMKYGENKKATGGSLSARMQQSRMQPFNGGQKRVGIGQNGGGFTNGEIIAKDDQSLTVKLVNGGSKIIFYSPATEVAKTVAGSSVDLVIGQTITANGTANPDGSITAQLIQLRSNVPK